MPKPGAEFVSPHHDHLRAPDPFYYMNLMRNPLATFRSWRTPKHNIRDMPLAADA